jgi:hypothetical protein
VKSALQFIISMTLMAIPFAARAGNTTHPAPAAIHASPAHSAGVRGVSRATSHISRPNGIAFHPGGVYGNHQRYGSHGFHGSYVHVWRHWGGSFRYGPVFGVYLGFFDNPWYYGYPVYYYGYPVYPYYDAPGAAANAPNVAEKSDRHAVCGYWQYSDKDHQYVWIPEACPLPVQPNQLGQPDQPAPITQSAPSNPSTGSPK